jgi:hypothetical protein
MTGLIDQSLIEFMLPYAGKLHLKITKTAPLKPDVINFVLWLPRTHAYRSIPCSSSVVDAGVGFLHDHHVIVSSQPLLSPCRRVQPRRTREVKELPFIEWKGVPRHLINRGKGTRDEEDEVCKRQTSGYLKCKVLHKKPSDHINEMIFLKQQFLSEKEFTKPQKRTCLTMSVLRRSVHLKTYLLNGV